MQRKISKKEIIIISLIAAAAVISLLLYRCFQKAGTAAVITVGSEIIEQIDLSAAEDSVFTSVGAEGFEFEIKDSRIRVKSAGCPDKICVNTGFISHAGETIVCMPGKLIISIKE
ncbi:MAG: NusG domain II-containing protein [Porcipelethomonas sp.]